MNAYIQTKSKRVDGSYDSYLTVEVDVIEKPLWHHKQGLSFTASGYGARIPTVYMVRYRGKWRRVYCIVYSNCGTLFIGKKYNPELTVNINGN